MCVELVKLQTFSIYDFFQTIKHPNLWSTLVKKASTVIVCNVLSGISFGIDMKNTTLQEIPHDFQKQIKVKLIKYARQNKREMSTCKLQVACC